MKSSVVAVSTVSHAARPVTSRVISRSHGAASAWEGEWGATLAAAAITQIRIVAVAVAVTDTRRRGVVVRAFISASSAGHPS